jgi:hypothetical protein
MLAGISCKQGSVVGSKCLVSLGAVTTMLLVVLHALGSVQAKVLISSTDFSLVFTFQAKPSLFADTVFKVLIIVGLIQMSYVIDCTIQV